MSKPVVPDMVGKKYNRLTVVALEPSRISPKGAKRPYILCKCECGNMKVIEAHSVLHGLTKSCGCLQASVCGKASKTHGMSKTRIYTIYRDMVRRCTNKNRPRYESYGGRGISVCEEWLGDGGFERFAKWSMENGYDDSLSIDRIDVNGNYSPSNCRWADAITQGNNTRTNHIVEYQGETHTMAEWARITGVSYGCIKHRLKDGWSVGESLGYEEHKRKMPPFEVIYTINGESHNVAQWCRIRGISKDTVRYRREHGWSPEEIFGFKERKNEVDKQELLQ